MKTNIYEHAAQAFENEMNNIFNQNNTGIPPKQTHTIMVDIFSENLDDYIPKLYQAAAGQYELDNYDQQVLALAREQIVQMFAAKQA